VIAAGAWVGKMIPRLAALAVPERQVLGWFQPSQPALFAPDRFPVFNFATGQDRFYGFPIFDVPGFKVGKYHHLKEPLDPDQPDFECHPRDEAALRDFVAQFFPQGAGPALALRACTFTNTPDEHFILDLLPGCPQIAVASPCSGHGFKFCSVVGEIVADLVERGETRHDISMHRLERLIH
jgi:sarcosine oxidase